MHSVLRRFFTPFFRFLSNLKCFVVNDILHGRWVKITGRKVISFSNFSCILPAFALAFIWALCLTIGVCLGVNCPQPYLRVLYYAAGSPLTVSGLLISVLLPYGLCMYGTYWKRRWLVYISCSIKILTFAFCSAALSVAFGSSGWLIRFLFQFSDFMTLGVFCWFCMRSVMNIARKQDFIISFIVYLMVGVLDYCIVSPFLVMLIDI